MTTETIREIEGRSLPTAGTWKIDQAHSHLEFAVRHLMVGRTKGSFTSWSGSIEVADKPEDSRVVVEIAAASFTTGHEQRDGHVVSADFLDVEQFPSLNFRSTSVAAKTDSLWSVVGDLTVLGNTKPVTLEVEFLGVTKDPWGNDKAFFEATAEFNREDFGLTWNQALDTGGVLIGKQVKIEIALQAQQG